MIKIMISCIINFSCWITL